MRKFLLVLMAIGLLAPLAAPASGARKARKVTKGYTTDPGQGRLSGLIDEDSLTVAVGDPIAIPTRGREKVVRLTVKDDSAEQVAVAAWQGEEDATFFCGTSDPIAIDGGRTLWVQPMMDISPTAGVCETPEPMTSGTIKATLR
jgi:hypothetical protein